MTLSSVVAEAERLRINAVASGVLVTDAWADAMVQITRTGNTDGFTQALHAWAKGAAAKNSGKMIPPGNLPAHAKIIASSFAAPT